MTVEQINNNRKLALEWWRSISIEARRDYVKSWQKSLPDTNTYGSAKDWAFELINGSSSHIQKVYEYLTKIKQH